MDTNLIGSLSLFTGGPCNHVMPANDNLTGPSLFTRDPVLPASHRNDIWHSRFINFLAIVNGSENERNRIGE